MPASWKTVTQLFKRNSKVMDGLIQYAETKDLIPHVNYRGNNQVITSELDSICRNKDIIQTDRSIERNSAAVSINQEFQNLLQFKKFAPEKFYLKQLSI